MEKVKVYFTKTLTPEAVIRMYEVLEKKLPGKIAVKVHSGEEGNQNYLRPEFLRPMIESVQGTVVECNTAYEGERNSTEKHRKLLESHLWTKYFRVDLLDAEGPDLVLPVTGGKVLKENHVGRNIVTYDSMLVLSHFKGHPAGGYGGAITDQATVWDHMAEQDVFCESMADAAGSIVEYFKGNTAYVNMVCNLSVDCDCCAVAEDPCMKDIGILSSLDPVALDQACMDLIYQSDDPGRDHFLHRVESLHGTHTIDAAAELGYGTKEYTLICVD